MRKTRELLRLLFSLGLSNRQAAKLVKVSHNTAGRFRALGVVSPKPRNL